MSISYKSSKLSYKTDRKIFNEIDEVVSSFNSLSTKSIYDKDFDINNLFNNDFELVIPGTDFSLAVVSISTPSISTTEVSQNTGNLEINVIHQGDKIDFSDIQVEFVIDSHLRSYAWAYDWLLRSTFQRYEEDETQANFQKDFEILILKNSYIQPFKISLIGCKITSLSGLNFNSNVASPSLMTATMNLKVQLLNIVPVGKVDGKVDNTYD